MKKVKEKVDIEKASKGFNKFTESIKKQIKGKSVKTIIGSIIMIGMITVASLGLIFALYIIIVTPNFDKEVLYSKEATIIYDINGEEFARIGLENRDLITYDDLPQVFIDALIATEDSRFFQHNGLDIARFGKATLSQLLGRNEGGASTLSMQLIKNLYTKKGKDETKSASLIRKFQDIYMAVFKLENSYTKEEILEFYANSLWFGNDGSLNYSGIYGVEQGSQFYFNKSVKDLTLAEASLLVGMYQNPVLYNPYRNPVGCRNRQKNVLKYMVNHEYLTDKEKDAVLEIPIESLLANREKVVATNENQAIIDYLVSDVESKTGKDPRNVSMKIYSTIDPKIQDVMNQMEKGKLFTFYNEKDQVGAAITSVDTGAIVAISGGRDYVALGTNRATVKRQPGSTAKPFFAYGPYMEFLNGSPGDYFFDEPYTYSNGTPITDADNGYMGMISIRTALIESRNVTALQAFQRVMAYDSSLIPNFVHSFGIDYGSNLYESASIGGFDGVTPIEMSAAYGALGRGGYYIKPYIFNKIIYDDGTVFEYKPAKERVVSEETAYMITSCLIDAVTNHWSGNVYVYGTEIAGKTGTTSVDTAAIEAKKLPLDIIMDSWTAAYTSEYSIGLWYGYDSLSSEYYMNTNTGWNARSRLMEEVATRVFSTNKTFRRPGGVISVEIELGTNPLQLASKYTPENKRRYELFREGTEPSETSVHYNVLANPTKAEATVDGKNVKITWDAIKTPEAIDTKYLQNYYNEHYGIFASKYYESRVNDNTSQFGELGYNIYSKDKNGDLSFVKWVNDSNYTLDVPESGNYTYVIKSAYQNFKGNESSGIEVKFSIQKKEEPEKDKEDDDTKDSNDDSNNKTNNNSENNDTGLD